MQVKVTFKHIDSTPPIQNYALEKAEKIKKFLSDIGPLKIDFVLVVENFRHLAHVMVNSKEVNFQANGAAADLYSAIDMAMSGLEKQLRRYKGKITHHKSFQKSSQAKLESADSLFDAEHLSVESDHRIVKGMKTGKPLKKKK